MYLPYSRVFYKKYFFIPLVFEFDSFNFYIENQYPNLMKPSSFCKAILLLSILSLDFHQLSAQTVTRGAYLQKGTQTSIVIRWRTSVATNSRVRIGSSYIAAGTY